MITKMTLQKSKKSQNAVEYLLIIIAIIIVALVVVAIMSFR